MLDKQKWMQVVDDRPSFKIKKKGPSFDENYPGSEEQKESLEKEDKVGHWMTKANQSSINRASLKKFWR